MLRHEVLHSWIKTDSEGNGYQEVGDLSEHALVVNKKTVGSERRLRDLLNRDAVHIFDLSREYPIRIGLYKANERGYYLSIVVHHIAFDGWSADIFLRELLAYYSYYNELSVGNKSARLNLVENTIQYKDFAVWQRAYLSGERLEEQLSYWRSRLSDYLGLNLPTDKVRPQQVSYRGSDVSFVLDEKLSKELRDLAKSLGVSLYSVMLSGFNLLLRSYSNQDDIVVGTAIANRHHAQLEHVIGFFVNSLALRSQIDSERSLLDLYEEREQML